MAGASFYTLVLFLRFFLTFLNVVALANCFAFAALVVAVILLTVRLVAALMSERARLV